MSAAFAAGTTPRRTVRTRRIRFDYPKGSLDRHYVDGDLVMSHVVAVLSAMFPEGEDFFVRSVRRFADRVSEPELQAQVDGFIGQEVMHGREHRALNERLQQMGYPTRRVDRMVRRGLRIYEARLPALTCLAITAALEHYTAALAETLLTDERAQKLLGSTEVRSMLLWHALEESEHKAVAFDVYRAAGGTERRRIWTMRVITFTFILGVVLHTTASMLADRATYNPVRLLRSLAALRHSPFLRPAVVRRIRAYNRPGFHPDDNDNTELLERWTAELFGAEGRLTDHPAMTPDHDVVIVGAGFGGTGAAIAFTRLGLSNLLILEREDDLGGTWHVNRYPGLAVDIASVTYSYSFEPNPYWSRLFAPGAELKRYAEHVADKYRLRQYMRFGTVVDSAHWDEDNQLWTVTITGGESVTTRYLVTATGFLSQPHLPDIDGIDTFDGTVIHTAAWDDSQDLAGRRVAVIGTGATAVQLIPELARTVAELTVFQRTAIWVVPKIDAAIPRSVQRLFARVPLTQRVARLANTSLLELMMVAAVLHFRQARVLNRAAATSARRHLRRQVPDAELRRKLTPDYDFGCKRPTFSNTYYPAFNRPNVHLQTDGIERIEPNGIVTADGRKTEIDTLVLATGFNIWDVNFPAIEVIGREGRNLGKWWRENRFQAYEGVSVPYFPNYLTLASPYS